MNDPSTDGLGRRAVVTALLTGVASGCLRMDGDETTTGGPAGAAATTDRPGATTAARTAAPTTAGTEEPTATPEPTMELPPGVSEDGVTAALVDAHGTAVGDASFTARHVHDFGGARTTTTHRVAPAERRYRRLRDQGGESLGVYWDDGTKYARGEYDAGTFYGIASTSLSRSALSFRPTVERVLATGDYRLSGTNPGATPKTAALAADAVADPAPYASRYPIESFQGLAGEGVVRESGLVESLSFDAVVVESTQGDEITFRKRVETEAVGETSVDRPDWTATAEERAPKLAAERVADDVVALDHDGGGPVPADASLFVATGDASYVGFASIELVAGERYFLYATSADSDAGQSVQLRRDRPDGGQYVSLGESARVSVGYLGVTFLSGEV